MFIPLPTKNSRLSLLLLALFAAGCGGGDSESGNSNASYNFTTRSIHHPSAYIPSMCYTKTFDERGMAHNPCFACHHQNRPPNFVLDDEKLQASYDFPEPALKNPFGNLFKDFTQEVESISDDEIIHYIDTSNYFDANGSIALAEKIAHLPPKWDLNHNGRWDGYRPDCYYRFDERGFDHAPDGKATGWVAFAYTPFLGTFWPTNGSTDDVLIRLPEAFYTTSQSDEFNTTIYRINLAVIESLIQRRNVAIDPVDERGLGVDLNRNGTLDTAEMVVFDWDPKQGRKMSYVGRAAKQLEKGEVHLAAGLFPEGTEFLHSVRYIRSNEEGKIALAPRMKELRYAKKLFWLSYADLKSKGLSDYKEKDTDPDRLETFRGDMERGLGNHLGWVYQGFIEDANGDLRPQSYEETLNCMGCHNGIAATTDSIFAFARKIDDWRGGWYHWSQKGLEGIKEPRYADGTWEYANYLRLNRAGDEFRGNEEIKSRFFTPTGELNETAISTLHEDISLLLYPSHERALRLNKSYRALVKTQSFIEGRAAHIQPLETVHKEVKEKESTGNEIYLLP